MATSDRTFAAEYIGVVPYERALRLQEELVRARAAGSIPDVLLLLEHPPVFTVGRFRGASDVTVPDETLAREGIAVIRTSRGGGITWHGPGQLVGYPILDLRENGLGVRSYIWKLEEAIIDVLLKVGIRGHRVAGFPGVWAGDRKLCSIGIHVSRHVTMHGFALNVNNDLRYFDFINPCGMKGRVMTSVSALLGQTVTVQDIVEHVLHSFSAVFGLGHEEGLDRCLSFAGVLTGSR